MTRLISFDIGIRNLAYCVFSVDTSVTSVDISIDLSYSIIAWDVLDISISSRESEKKEIQEKESIAGVCSCFLQSKKKDKTKESCKKKPKYQNHSGTGIRELFCEKHAKEAQEKKQYYLPTKEFQPAFLKKQKVDFLVEFERKYGILSQKEAPQAPKEKKEDRVERIVKWVQENTLIFLVDPCKKKEKKKEIGLVEIGRNMADHLMAIPETMQEVGTVLIENQISPIANKMKTIQGMLAQIYILHGVENIEFVSSSNKLRGFSSFGTKEPTLGALALEGFSSSSLKEEKEPAKNAEEPKKPVKNPNYKQHKKDGITFCKQLLETRGETEWKTFFETYPKKQDDLADAFLQGIWFLNKKK